MSDVWKYFLHTAPSDPKTENTISLVIPPRAELSPSPYVRELSPRMWEVSPAVLVAAHWKPHLSFSVPQMDQIYNSTVATQGSSARQQISKYEWYYQFLFIRMYVLRVPIWPPVHFHFVLRSTWRSKVPVLKKCFFWHFFLALFIVLLLQIVLFKVLNKVQ